VALVARCSARLRGYCAKRPGERLDRYRKVTRVRLLRATGRNQEAARMLEAPLTSASHALEVAWAMERGRAHELPGNRDNAFTPCFCVVQSWVRVGSFADQVYFRATCSAAQDLAQANRRFFPSEPASKAMAFRRSRVPGC
jgi:hypothetical protein